MKKTLILSITITLTLLGLQNTQAQNAEVEGSITLIKDTGTTLSFKGKDNIISVPFGTTPQLESKLSIGYQQLVFGSPIPSFNRPEETFIRSTNEVLNIQATQVRIARIANANSPSLYVQGILRVGNEEIDDEALHPGMIRFNSDTNIFEGYNGECWVALSGNCPVILLEKHNPDKNPE